MENDETYSEAQELAAGDVEPVDMLAKEQARPCHQCGRLDTPVYWKGLHFCSTVCCGNYAAQAEGDGQQAKEPRLILSLVTEHRAAQRIGGDLTRALDILGFGEPK